MDRSSHNVAVPGVRQRLYGDATIYCPRPYRPHSSPDPFPYGCYFPAHGSRVPNTCANSHLCSNLLAYPHPNSDTSSCAHTNGDSSPNAHSEAHGNPCAHTGGSGSHDYANTASPALPDSFPANPSANPNAYPRSNSNSAFSLARNTGNSLGEK